MDYIRDYLEDSTVRIFFTTNDRSGGAIAPSSPFEAADVRIYKDGSATEKTTANGLTMTSPFDTVTGLHLLEIDTSNDTGDAGFWTTGADYTVILTPDETIDTKTVVSVLGQFSLENSLAALILALLDDPRGEPGQGTPPVNPDAVTKLDYLYKQWRNKKTETASQQSLFADDGTTVDQKSAISDDLTTLTVGEKVTGP